MFPPNTLKNAKEYLENFYFSRLFAGFAGDVPGFFPAVTALLPQNRSPVNSITVDICSGIQNSGVSIQND
jgi:hypothetical protein